MTLPVKCEWCPKPGEFLCDFPVAGGTCDRAFCVAHRHCAASGVACIRRGKKGHGVRCCQPFSVDHCPDHAPKVPPMTPEELLADLDRRGVRVRLDAGRLIVSPGSLLTDGLADQVRRLRADLVKLLTARAAGECPKCHKPLDADRCCWKCFYRRCATCDRDSGSCFIQHCLICERDVL